MPHELCPYSRIPVVNKQAWTTLHRRLLESPLAYSKKMKTKTETNVPNITTLCRYSPSTTSMITWCTASNHGRLFRVTVDMCTKCYGRDIRVNVQEGSLICAGCGLVCGEANTETLASYAQSYSIMASGSRQKQILPRVYSSSSYKRCNLFKEYLLRIQGKERNKITREDMTKIKQELLSRQLDVNQIDQDVIRSILKKLRMQRHYNHTYFLLKQLTGHALVELHPHHCQQLLELFVKIQQVFGEVQTTRSNMMSYYFLLRKSCELLNWDDIARCLPYLKSRQKLVEQDRIWRKICLRLGYPFFPSTL